MPKAALVSSQEKQESGARDSAGNTLRGDDTAIETRSKLPTAAQPRTELTGGKKVEELSDASKERRELRDTRPKEDKTEAENREEGRRQIEARRVPEDVEEGRPAPSNVGRSVLLPRGETSGNWRDPQEQALAEKAGSEEYLSEYNPKPTANRMDEDTNNQLQRRGIVRQQDLEKKLKEAGEPGRTHGIQEALTYQKSKEADTPKQSSERQQMRQREEAGDNKSTVDKIHQPGWRGETDPGKAYTQSKEGEEKQSTAGTGKTPTQHLHEHSRDLNAEPGTGLTKSADGEMDAERQRQADEGMPATGQAQQSQESAKKTDSKQGLTQANQSESGAENQQPRTSQVEPKSGMKQQSGSWQSGTDQSQKDTSQQGRSEAAQSNPNKPNYYENPPQGGQGVQQGHNNRALFEEIARRKAGRTPYEQLDTFDDEQNKQQSRRQSDAHNSEEVGAIPDIANIEQARSRMRQEEMDWRSRNQSGLDALHRVQNQSQVGEIDPQQAFRDFQEREGLNRRGMFSGITHFASEKWNNLVHGKHHNEEKENEFWGRNERQQSGKRSTLPASPTTPTTPTSGRRALGDMNQRGQQSSSPVQPAKKGWWIFGGNNLHHFAPEWQQESGQRFIDTLTDDELSMMSL